MSLITNVVELAFTFGISIFFAAIAISRETIVSSAIAAVCWLVCGMLNFIYDPLGFGSYVAYLFFIIGAVFIFQLFYKLVAWYTDHKNARFEVNPL